MASSRIFDLVCIVHSGAEIVGRAAAIQARKASSRFAQGGSSFRNSPGFNSASEISDKNVANASAGFGPATGLNVGESRFEDLSLDASADVWVMSAQEAFNIPQSTSRTPPPSSQDTTTNTEALFRESISLAAKQQKLQRPKLPTPVPRPSSKEYFEYTRTTTLPTKLHLPLHPKIIDVPPSRDALLHTDVENVIDEVVAVEPVPPRPVPAPASSTPPAPSSTYTSAPPSSTSPPPISTAPPPTLDTASMVPPDLPIEPSEVRTLHACPFSYSFYSSSQSSSSLQKSLQHVSAVYSTTAVSPTVFHHMP